MFKRLIAVSGPVGAGKSKLANALAEKFGLQVVKTRELIRAATRAKSARKDLQAAGNRLDARTGGQWVADALAVRAEHSPDNSEVVVDSIRIPKQLDGLRLKFGTRVLHVHLTAPPEELERRHAVRPRKPGEDLESYREVQEDPTEHKIERLAPLADVCVDTAKCNEEDVLVRVASHLGLFGRSFDRLVDVLVGGQYGSEGKGNIAAYLANEYDLLVRVGGPNAGHTVYLGAGNKYAFHHLPSGSLHTNAELVIGPAATIYVPKLMEEIRDCSVTANRLSIDPQAMIIDEFDREFEAKTLRKEIGSTAQGVGVATARKVLRGAFPRENEKGRRKTKVPLAKDIRELKPYIRETRRLLDDAFGAGKRVFMEGTQGTGLSLHHGPYPHVTSRDTTASGCLADAGIAPTRVRRVVMVCRTYPIRVKNPSGRGRSSGPMVREIDYAQLAEWSGIPEAELRATEMTTTTKKQRRIGLFEWSSLRRAAALNGPTDLALTFADYLSIRNRQAQRFEQLTEDTIRFVEEMEAVAGSPVSLISTRFGARSIIDRRKWW